MSKKPPLQNQRFKWWEHVTTLSSGYAAILDIVADLIIRMEKQINRSFDFNIPGVVLIDEIETHLHLELQKNIMKLLTTIFPNIQFIVSSHSPFILNCLDNVVIYDLEKNMFVKDGLSNVPYSGIVEGYFKADELSNELRNKFDAYKALVNKLNLDADDYEEIADLEKITGFDQKRIEICSFQKMLYPGK